MTKKIDTNISSHNTMRVFVLDKHKRPLMPCHPARARKLLSKGKAKVYRMYPFTIILQYRTLEESSLQPIQLRIDPGSKTTGLALVAMFSKKIYLIWAAHLQHRGHLIPDLLEKRRTTRRSRRNRKTRYRKPKFKKIKSKTDTSGKDQSSNKKGWLPPSILSRVNNIYNYTLKLLKFVPFKYINMEMVNFDTHSITVGRQLYGKQYQHGTLYGYRIKQYLLEINNHTCAYCKKTNVPLQIEHIVPKSKGGSNNISNLTVACAPCNKKKGNKTAAQFGHPKITGTTDFFKDMAAVNSSKNKLLELLQSTGLDVRTYDAGFTKYNRKISHLIKDHYIDAACVGEQPAKFNSKNITVLNIVAKGRGKRQVQLVDKYGFPRKTKNGIIAPRKLKRINGLTSGDFIEVDLSHHKYHKCYYNTRVGAVRSKNNTLVFTANGNTIDVHTKYCRLLQRADGYDYLFG